MAGYPWFKCRARDLFVSLPGLTLAIKEISEFESVMFTAQEAIREFIKGVPSKLQIYEIEQPDVMLWAVWAIQQYAKATSREQAWNKYGKILTEMMSTLSSSTIVMMPEHIDGHAWLP